MVRGKFKDISGQTFGRLTALYPVGQNKQKQFIWHCVCICKTEADVASHSLTGGNTKSCGCIAREKEHGGRFKDLTGLVFNRLTVVSFVEKDRFSHSIWHCRCICGNEIDAQSSYLISGGTQSCGCYKRDRTHEANFRDLTGRRFGKLTVVKQDGLNRWGEILWRCRCSCEKQTEIIIPSRRLTSGRTQSCGCYKIERIIETHTTHGLSKTKEYQSAMGNRRRELKKKLDVEWTPEMEICLKKFFGTGCVVCGSLENLQIDHVKPLSRGYGLRPGNAVILCRHHNVSKSKKMAENLPDGFGDIILRAASAFWEYWYNTRPNSAQTNV